MISITSNTYGCARLSLDINYKTLDAFFEVYINIPGYKKTFKYKKFEKAYILYENFSKVITRKGGGV